MDMEVGHFGADEGADLMVAVISAAVNGIRVLSLVSKPHCTRVTHELEIEV